MEYIERTRLVKLALLDRPDHLDKIRSIFVSHIAKDGVVEPDGRGSSRYAYDVGECVVAPDVKISLLLKLEKERLFMKYASAAKPSQHRNSCEFGAFELYYDFVTEKIPSVSFRSKSGYEQYVSVTGLGKRVKDTFKLSDNWGGTRVAVGDVGALPYFQLVVRYRGYFGHLTEGEPPHVEPQGTATWQGTLDDYTVERDRIIDLGPSQCLLSEIDRGGHVPYGGRYPSNIGTRIRGSKYFRLENRLDLS